MTLEQTLGNVSINRSNKTIDVYASGITAMYTGFLSMPNWLSQPAGFPQNPMSGPVDTPIFGQTSLLNYGFEAPRQIIEPVKPILPEIKVEPYTRGMELEGGFRLYGNRNTAILNDPVTGIDIHHHNFGGGMIKIGQDPIMHLHWSQETQTRLTEFYRDEINDAIRKIRGF